MTGKIFWGCMTAMLLLLSACDDSTDGATEPAAEAIVRAPDLDALPNCTVKREGDSIFVENEGVSYTCQDGIWNPEKEKVDTYPTEDDLPNCTAKREGNLAYAEKEDITFTCRDGMWQKPEADPADEKPEENPDTVPEQVFSRCSEEHEGDTAYVDETGTTYICLQGIWMNQEELPPTYPTEDDLPSCTENREGVWGWLEEREEFCICLSRNWVLIDEISYDDDSTETLVSSGSVSSTRLSSTGSTGYEEDEYIEFDDPSSSASGVMADSVVHNRSSNSKTATSSNSPDLSFLSSSSSLGVVSGSSAIVHDRSSGSKIIIEQSSVSQSNSSSGELFLINSSGAQQNSSSGGNVGGTTCTTSQLVGTCKPTSSTGIRGQKVTYEFTPGSSNSCNVTNDIQWNVLPGMDGTTGGATPLSQDGGYSFDVTYSLAGEKKSVIFTMGGVNIPCDPVTIMSDCNTANSYSCTVKLNSASNNLTKNSPVSYTWSLNKSGCNDITSIAWSGAVAGSSASVTKTFNSAGSYSATVKVMDERLSSALSVTCAAAVVRNVVETKPTCTIDNKIWATDESLTITPNSISGCDYDSDKCGYVLKKTNGGNIASSASGYNRGPITIVGESSATTVNYTLTLSNKIGDGSCTFDVEYVDATPMTATTTFVEYTAGEIYKVSVGNISNGYNKFKCNVRNTTNASRTIGTFDGTSLTIPMYTSLSNSVTVNANSSHLFIPANDAPADMTCGLNVW